jgi:subtilisin family serine protease
MLAGIKQGWPMPRPILLIASFAFFSSACASARAPATSAPAPASAAIALPPRDWHLLDLSLDHFPGISAERAYRELLAGKTPRRSVIVAVIDEGVDTAHPSIRPTLWSNPGEIPGNGVDDDHNGYVDDVHGWNFVGGANGRDVEFSTMEVTRMYALCTDSTVRFALRLAKPTDCEAIARDFAAQKNVAKRNLGAAIATTDTLNSVMGILERVLGTNVLSKAKVTALSSNDSIVSAARTIWLRYVDDGTTPSELATWRREAENGLRVSFDPHFDPSDIVGDHPDDIWERNYGNSDVTGPRGGHGTHVSGIIAGVPVGDFPGGIARGVRIMSIRAVCYCDERDKDVANAIRYAVDNGANIISASFLKPYSPQKLAVDSAISYAERRGVLIVHAAGNDGLNVDSAPRFPNKYYLSGATAQNWIEVAASYWKDPENHLAARWSNYGQEHVDVYAPGADIYSAWSQGQFRRDSGTSMAAPMVSGIAAVLMQYYPQLSAAQVRRIILDSAIQYRDRLVLAPGGKGGSIAFGQLSATGGIANLYTALKLAEQLAGR